MQESFSKDKYAARLGVVHDGTRHLGGVDDGRKNSGGGGGSAGDETRQEIGVDVGDGKTINNFANTFLVTATLFLAITFSAIFQPPGGYSSEPPYRGAAVFGKRAAFKVFFLCDAAAFCTSSLSVVWLVKGMFRAAKTPRRAVLCHVNLFTVMVLSTMAAFTAAAYLVAEPNSKFLAMSVVVVALITLVTHYIWLYRSKKTE